MRVGEIVAKRPVHTLSDIDQAVSEARIAHVEPAHVRGDAVYMLFLSKSELTSLKTSSHPEQWGDITGESVAAKRQEWKPPMGGAGQYNGVVLFEDGAC